MLSSLKLITASTPKQPYGPDSFKLICQNSSTQCVKRYEVEHVCIGRFLFHVIVHRLPLVLSCVSQSSVLQCGLVFTDTVLPLEQTECQQAFWSEPEFLPARGVTLLFAPVLWGRQKLDFKWIWMKCSLSWAEGFLCLLYIKVILLFEFASCRSLRRKKSSFFYLFLSGTFQTKPLCVTIQPSHSSTRFVLGHKAH